MRNSGEPRPCPCHLRERSCDRKRQERGVLAARVAESADSQILNRNRGDKRLESDLQPTTSLATFRPLAGNFQAIIVARQWKVGWNQRKDSPVAQLVEQATVNRLVIGSSPIGGALVLNLSRHCPAFFTPLPRAADVLRVCVAFGEFREAIRWADFRLGSKSERTQRSFAQSGKVHLAKCGSMDCASQRAV